MKTLSGLTLMFALCAGLSANAFAQDYPSRPIRVVVPFAAGGSLDIGTRIIGLKVGEILKQTIVVDNRAGAAGAIGGEFVARSTADGYTLLAGSPGTMTGPIALRMKLSYDPQTAFVPIALVVTSPNIVVANVNTPAKNVAQLLELARSKPGKVSFASAGVGSSTHIGGAMLASMGQVNMLHVPYKGTGLAITDVIAGHVDFMISDAPAMSFVKSGKMQALAITTRKRSALAPGIPTVAESGLPDFDLTNWHGWFAPAGTPPAVVQRVNAALAQALRSPDVIEQLAAAAMDASTASRPEDLLAFLNDDVARWQAIINKAGIKVETP